MDVVNSNNKRSWIQQSHLFYCSIFTKIGSSKDLLLDVEFEFELVVYSQVYGWHQSDLSQAISLDMWSCLTTNISR